MSLPARLAIFLLCGFVGYFTARAFAPAAPNPAALSGPPPIAAAALKPLTGVPAESAMVAEFEQLRRDHGGEAADLQALYAAVKETKDPYRRRAFRAALIAEWAARDPRAGLAYLLEKDGGSAAQFMREWMRLDPDAAITGILGAGTKARNSLRSLQSEIARLAPARLAEVAAALPKSESRWDSSTQDAFAVFAQKDPLAARAAAESVMGPLRVQALAGVARAWAEKDGPAALAWAEAMPPGEARDSALKGALVGWAKTDPIAALNKIDLVPPGGDEMYYASDTGAQVLREAAARNWDATVQWLIEHPGKLGNASLNGLQSVFSQRLLKDPVATVRELADRRLPGLTQVFGNAVLNEGYAARDALWMWLDGQPPTDFTRALRGSLLNAIAYKEPVAALDFLEKMPDTGGDRQLLERGAQSLLNGGSQMHLLEDLLEKASSKLRPYLLEAGFHFGGEIFGANPQQWLSRINELPEDRRPNAIQGFARGWAGADPEAALAWAMALPDDAQRQSALSVATGTWAQSDPQEAAAWINTLQNGGTRDAAALSFVNTLARQQPETAWPWALSIEAPAMRLSAVQMAYQAMRQKDAAVANEMLQSADLSPQQIETIKAAPNARGRFAWPF